MIKTISDLLDEFIKIEVEILNKQNIKHPPTIGHMYEGLTKNILDRSIFDGLDLNVVNNSFIEGCDTEFDVLLVAGEGENIPYTNCYKYKPSQVIAVIQVKKNLYSKDIEEGFNNLQFLIDYFEPDKMEDYIGRLFRNSFRGICNKDTTSFKNGELSVEEEYIYHTLMLEAFLPIRIIWGYNGFKSEFTFRKKFIEYLGKNLTTDLKDIKRGFSPLNFPNLIICDKYSMIKNNAMPFGAKLLSDLRWPFYGTTSFNPVKYFLEIIWTRLHYKYKNIPTSIFGDDLTIEPIHLFLNGKIGKLEEKYGWIYDYTIFTEKELSSETDLEEWQPEQLDDTQHVIITELCRDGEIDLIKNNKLEKFVLSKGYNSLDEFISNLLSTNLVYIEKNKLKLLTDKCRCAILPDGRIVAAEDRSGRFSKWLQFEVEKIIKKKKSTEHASSP